MSESIQPDYFAARSASLATLFPRNKVSTAAAKTVLVHLILHCNGRKAGCFPSAALLSIETGLDKRTVVRAVRALEDVGLISTDHPTGECVGIMPNTFYPNYEMVESLRAKRPKIDKDIEAKRYHERNY